MADLLPCPFCGGPAHLVIEDEFCRIRCHQCGATGSPSDPIREEDTIAAWNRRAPVADWQSIETAPRDGTRFLTWDSYYGVRMGRAFMRADHDDWLSYVDSNGSSHKGGIRASHWMPLPAAPVDGGDDA